jgi:flavin-dependent dehydrogenase
MDSALVGAGAALLGVLVGGGIQYIMLEQKYLAEAIDRTQERQVLLVSCVSQYLQFHS